MVRRKKGATERRKWTIIGPSVDGDAASERKRRENDVQNNSTMVGGTIRGVPKHQRMRLQHFLHNG